MKLCLGDANLKLKTLKSFKTGLENFLNFYIIGLKFFNSRLVIWFEIVLKLDGNGLNFF